MEKQIEILDEAQIMKEEKIRKQMKDPKQISEQIYLSTNLIKINKRTSEQGRILVISNIAIYNIKKKDITRSIDIINIAGITISNNSTEFIIHGKGEYDVRYKSNEREKILKYLIMSFSSENKQRLKIYITDKDQLKDYCTQEDDYKKNISKIPNWEPLEVDGYQDLNLFFANALLKQPKYQKVLYIADDNIYKIWLTDFETRIIIGTGSFGKVYLAKIKQQIQQQQQNSNNIQNQQQIKSKERYAVKKISGSDLGSISPNEFQKRITENISSNFTVPLKFAFRLNNDFYIFTQFMQGGDLYKQMNMRQNYDEDMAKFYFVEILLGLNFFHENGIPYKDLKPENIFIDEFGHISLSNYGFIYCQPDNLKEVVTTLDYTSPEVLKGNNHSYASDYWSLGILLYEMVVGVPPFYHENEDLVIHLIKENNLIFPNQNSELQISDQCQDMIQGLLNSNENQRFQLQNIKNHPWVKNIDWKMAEQKLLKPPFIPSLNPNSVIIAKYFDCDIFKKSQNLPL